MPVLGYNAHYIKDPYGFHNLKGLFVLSLCLDIFVMQVATKGIVLTSIKYGDTSLIVRIFTFSDGIKSYLLRGVLASKKGKLKSAYFQPLLQLDLIASHKNKGTLESIIEAKVNYHYQSLHTDIAKNALTFFLAEMLSLIHI